MMNFQITIDITKCVGCGICEMACSLGNKKECNPEKSSIRAIRYEDEGIMYSIPVVCRQCEKPLCQKICPVKAISQDMKTDALLVDQSKCIGCKSCFSACPFGGISIDKEKRIAMKCDLCSGEPKCVEFCPTGALLFVRSDKIDIWKKREGIDRYLEDLKNISYPIIEER